MRKWTRLAQGFFDHVDACVYVMLKLDVCRSGLLQSYMISNYLVLHNKFHALTYAWFCLKGMVCILENLNSIKLSWQFSGPLLPLTEHTACQALSPEGRTHQKPVCSYKRQLHREWAWPSLIAAVSIVQGPNLV